MADEKLPEGATCKCGYETKYPPYVYAHWDERLTWACPQCSAKYIIFRGKARKLK